VSWPALKILTLPDPEKGPCQLACHFPFFGEARPDSSLCFGFDDFHFCVLWAFSSQEEGNPCETALLSFSHTWVLFPLGHHTCSCGSIVACLSFSGFLLWRTSSPALSPLVLSSRSVQLFRISCHPSPSTNLILARFLDTKFHKEPRNVAFI